jgi:hypothetical protein
MSTLTMTTTFTIQALAAKYGFSPEEATRHIAQELVQELTKMAGLQATPAEEPLAPARADQPVLDDAKPKTPKTPKTPKAAPKPKLAKPAMQLPWCGQVLSDRCQAVSKSYGLYTQCMNAPGADGHLCATCTKHVGSDGTPKFGLITDRAANPEWVSPLDGKRPIRYVQFWLKRLADNCTRDQIESEAAKFGFTVSPIEWTKPEKQTRGRKMKSAVVDTSSESEVDSEPAAAAAAPASVKIQKTPKAKTPKTPKAKTVQTKTPVTPPHAETPASPPPAPKKKKLDLAALRARALARKSLAPAEIPKPIELAPPEEPVEEHTEPEAALAADLVQQSLAEELQADPYGAETDDDDEEEEVQVSIADIDHCDGNGARAALVDPEGNVYCYAEYMASGDLTQVGTITDGVFTATE